MSNDPQQLKDQFGVRYSEGASIKIETEVLYMGQTDSEWLERMVELFLEEANSHNLKLLTRYFMDLAPEVAILPQGVKTKYCYEIVQNCDEWCLFLGEAGSAEYWETWFDIELD